VRTLVLPSLGVKSTTTPHIFALYNFSIVVLIKLSKADAVHQMFQAKLPRPGDGEVT